MDDKLIETIDTHLSEEELAYALREGWKQNYNEYPSIDSLAILWAQVALETGRGKFCKNYNFGNIKHTAGHDYCMYHCSEILNGKNQIFDPPHPQTWFNAYSSSVAGAAEYITFISERPRYKDAWAQVIAGNPVKYCACLRAGGYFTASLVDYTNGVVRLCNEFKSKSKSLLAYAPPQPEPQIQEPAQPVQSADPVKEPEVISEAPPAVVEQPGFNFQSIIDLIVKLISSFTGKK